MEKIFIVKGRERIDRGQLKNFGDLPLEKQKVFSTIKNKIEEIFEKTVDIYVFGSHHHGYWDEHSDYDILIGEIPEISLQKKIKEVLDSNVDILYFQKAIDIFKLQLID